MYVHISVHIGLYYILLQILCKCIMSKCNRSTYYELPIINYRNLQLSLAISVSSAPINRTAVMIRIVPNMSVRQVGLSNTVTQVENKGLLQEECLMSMSPMFSEISSPGPKNPTGYPGRILGSGLLQASLLCDQKTQISGGYFADIWSV